MQNRNEKIENARHGFGSIFVVAMNAPQTREKYISRLNRFFNFIELSGSAIEERCSNFAREGKGQPKWALNNIMRFLHSQKERVEHKEITGATLRNYVKTIKLFCEMNDIILPSNCIFGWFCVSLDSLK